MTNRLEHIHIVERERDEIIRLMNAKHAELVEARATIARVEGVLATICHGEQAYAEHAHYCVPIIEALRIPQPDEDRDYERRVDERNARLDAIEVPQ